jgi:phosphoribosylformylglycinamidine synthase
LGGLRSLGFATVSDVRSGKLLRFAFEAPDATAAEEGVADMCKKLLANPVIEVADWQLRADEEREDEP